MGAAMGGGAAAANVTNSQNNRRSGSSSSTKGSTSSGGGGFTRYSRAEFGEWMNWFEEYIGELPSEKEVYPEEFLDDSGNPLSEEEIESRHDLNLGQKAVSKLGFSTSGMERKDERKNNDIERLLELENEYEQHCASELEEDLNERTGLDSDSTPEATEFDQYVVWSTASGINRGSEVLSRPVEEIEVEGSDTYVEGEWSLRELGVKASVEDGTLAVNKSDRFVGSFGNVTGSEVYLVGDSMTSEHASYFEEVEDSEIYAEGDQLYIEELKGDSTVRIDSSTNLTVGEMSEEVEVRQDGEDVTEDYGGSLMNGRDVRDLKDDPRYFLGDMARSMDRESIFRDRSKMEGTQRF